MNPLAQDAQLSMIGFWPKRYQTALLPGSFEICKTMVQGTQGECSIEQIKRVVRCGRKYRSRTKIYRKTASWLSQGMLGWLFLAFFCLAAGWLLSRLSYKSCRVSSFPAWIKPATRPCNSKCKTLSIVHLTYSPWGCLWDLDFLTWQQTFGKTQPRPWQSFWSLESQWVAKNKWLNLLSIRLNRMSYS